MADTTDPKDKWATRTRVIAAGPFTDDEVATLRAAAAQLGLTVEEYLRVRAGLEP